MLLSINKFVGLLPKQTDETLPNNAASVAVNCLFKSGTIEGLPADTQYPNVALPFVPKGGFALTGKSGDVKLFCWPYDVDVVRSPIVNDAHDRFFWTGEPSGSTEFKYSRAVSYANNYVGTVTTSYKVGVIDSSKWDLDIAKMGISLEIHNRYYEVPLGELDVKRLDVYLADADGNLVYKVPSQDYSLVHLDPSKDVRGWPMGGIGINFYKSVTSYNKVTVQGNVTYSVKQGVTVASEQNGTRFLANVYYLNGIAKYVELTPGISGVPALGDSVPSTQKYPVYLISGVASDAYISEYSVQPSSYSVEYLGEFWVRSGSVLSADNTNLPSGLSAAALTVNQAIVQNPRVALLWEFVYQDQAYSIIFREDAFQSGTLDINGGLTGSIQRLSDTNFVLNIKFGMSLGIERRAYIFTFVNEFSEESCPSKPVEVELDPGNQSAVIVVDLAKWATFIDTAGLFTGYAPFHGLRVYRTSTSTAGNVEYLYAFTIKNPLTPPIPGENYYDHTDWYNIGGSVFHVPDTTPSSALGFPCSTLGQISDTSELQQLRGLTPIHNNMFAAFKHNEVWVCEPNKPWAWLSSAIYTLPHKVVALAPLEQGFYVLTDGAPYLFSGVSANELQAYKLPFDYPCIHKRAWASIGSGIVYLSPDGPIELTGVQAVLHPTFTRSSWHEKVLSLSSNKSVACCIAGDGLLLYYPNDPVPAWFYCPATASFTRLSYVINSVIRVPLNFPGISRATSLFYSNDLPYWFAFTSSNTRRLWTWKSKTFVFSHAANFGAIQIHGKGVVVVKLYANDKLVCTINDLTLFSHGVTRRLPSGFKAYTWSFEISAVSSDSVVYSVRFSDTFLELSAAL